MLKRILLLEKPKILMTTYSSLTVCNFANNHKSIGKFQFYIPSNNLIAIVFDLKITARRQKSERGFIGYTVTSDTNQPAKQKQKAKQHVLDEVPIMNTSTNACK